MVDDYKPTTRNFLVLRNSIFPFLFLLFPPSVYLDNLIDMCITVHIQQSHMQLYDRLVLFA